MDWVGIATPITLIIAVLTFLFTRKREAVSDGKEGAAQMATVLTELGYIKSSTERIEKRLDEQQKQILDIERGLARVTESVASAHKRIDHIDERLKHE